MDMSDKIVVAETDELARDREQLKAESLSRRPASFGHLSGYSVGRKLKLMFGSAAGAAVVLGSVALFALSGSDGAVDGLLMTMSVIAVVVAAIGAASIRFVQTDLVHPLEQVCDAMRELAEGNREVHVPHEDRDDEIGAMARYLVVIKKAAAITGDGDSSTGLGLGITGAQRLVDTFSIRSSPNDGTEVIVGKHLSPTLRVTPAAINAAMAALAAVTSSDPMIELQQQSQELLRTLAYLRDKQAESDRLAQELAETNRGVLALYAELDERALYLERANDLKTRFLSDLNHEIRTPLNAVRNVARLLLDGYEGPLTDRHRRAIEMMRK